MIKTEDYRSPQLVIIDFGLAQHDADEKQQICGTPGYIPPETWQTMKWYPKGDVFSMGVTMLQLVGEVMPFPGSTMDDVKRSTLEVYPPLHRIPANMSSFLKAFITKCLQKNTGSRPTSLLAIFDPWFSK